MNRCRKSYITGLLLPGLILVFAGCGGGGGGGGSTTATYSISGKVTGASGVTVTVSGAKSATTKTGQFGSYSSSGMPSGSYTVTPSLQGYLFHPLSQAIAITDNNVVPTEFTATPSTAATHNVSGKVAREDGSALAWVKVSIANDSKLVTGSTFTDITGIYTFTGVPNGYYEIILDNSALNYQFKPDIKRQIPINDNEVTGQDFTAMPPGTGGATVQF